MFGLRKQDLGKLTEYELRAYLDRAVELGRQAAAAQQAAAGSGLDPTVAAINGRV